MEEIIINYNFDLTISLYEKYFKFERKREFKKVPIFFLVGIVLTLLLIDVLFSVYIFWILGITTALIVGLFLLFYYLKFESFVKRFKKELLKEKNSEDMNFTFSFDEETINYKSKNENTKLNWNAVKEYIENDGDLYVYRENKILIDILSIKIIGPKNFKKIKEILTKKNKPQPFKKN